MFEDLASAIGIPFETLFSPGHPFYWLYLVTAAIFAIAICVRRSSERGLSALTGATRQIFDSKIYFHHSAITDYGLVYFNHIFQAMGLGLAFVSAETIAQWGASGLTHLVGSSPRLEAGWSVGLAATLTTAVLGDFAVFYFHLLQHRIPFLWELHKVHHSAEVLTPLTVYRLHPFAEISEAAIHRRFPGACWRCVPVPIHSTRGGDHNSWRQHDRLFLACNAWRSSFTHPCLGHVSKRRP